MNDNVYTVSEAAGMCHVTPKTIRLWIKGGKLKAFRYGREWLIERHIIDDLAKTNTGGG